MGQLTQGIFEILEMDEGIKILIRTTSDAGIIRNTAI